MQLLKYLNEPLESKVRHTMLVVTFKHLRVFSLMISIYADSMPTPPPPPPTCS